MPAKLESLARSLAARALMWRRLGSPRLRYEQIELHAEGILLRPFRPADLVRLLEIVKDPDIVRFSHLPGEWLTEQGAREYIDSLPRLAARGERIDLAIEGAAGQFDGHVALRSISWRLRRADVATWVAPDVRNAGAASSAVSAISDWAFEELGLRQLAADPDADNEAAKKMLERAGYVATGITETGGLQSRTIAVYERHR